MKRKWTISRSLQLFLCVFWLVAIILPLVRMLSKMADVDVGAIITTRNFIKALRQSLVASSVATMISTCLAGGLAWAVARTKVRHKTILNTIILSLDQ